MYDERNSLMDLYIGLIDKDYRSLNLLTIYNKDYFLYWASFKLKEAIVENIRNVAN